MSSTKTFRRARGLTAAALCALTAAAATAAPAPSATLSRSVDVAGAPDAVWAKIGRFCAIADWHPAIASCAMDGKTPPTRTLATRDHATFVELETARNDRQRFYSYTFLSSPLPVSRYASTLKVTRKGPDLSTVTWSGGYVVSPEQAEAAHAALTGIYESGLSAIKASLER
jgi:hypothetical protein